MAENGPWYKRVYENNEDIDKITELPLITQWIDEDNQKKIMTATNAIFNDTFSNVYGSIDQNIYENPANVDTQKTFKDKVYENGYWLGSKAYYGIESVGGFIGSIANTLIGWRTTQLVKGGGITSSRKPKNKNKKTKKFIRDKR
jgi:hypothetical protein